MYLVAKWQVSLSFQLYKPNTAELKKLHYNNQEYLCLRFHDHIISLAFVAAVNLQSWQKQNANLFISRGLSYSKIR